MKPHSDSDLNPYKPERVYDRSDPSRVGRVLNHSFPRTSVFVQWPDRDEPEWWDIDALGSVPFDWRDDETQEEYLTRKGRNIRPLR